jgi:hypothetical protein
LLLLLVVVVVLNIIYHHRYFTGGVGFTPPFSGSGQLLRGRREATRDSNREF